MAREINLNHICKIEGHASLTLKIEKNQVKKILEKIFSKKKFLVVAPAGEPQLLT